jgi:hypothetical protein
VISKTRLAEAVEHALSGEWKQAHEDELREIQAALQPG